MVLRQAFMAMNRVFINHMNLEQKESFGWDISISFSYREPYPVLILPPVLWIVVDVVP